MLKTQIASTRDKVLSIIKREGEITVKKLTEELEITPMAIRGHLSKLEKSQFIKVDNIKQKLGRPVQVFSLTKDGQSCFPESYGSFSLGLLESIQELDDGKTLGKVIAMTEERMIQERSAYVRQAHTPEGKLKLYLEFLEQSGFMPQLEKITDQKFILHENNCALKEIATNFEFCCASELTILDSVFPEANVTRTAHQITGGSRCSYDFDFNAS